MIPALIEESKRGIIIKDWLQLRCPDIQDEEQNEDVMYAMAAYTLKDLTTGMYNPQESLKEGGGSTRAYAPYLTSPVAHNYDPNWVEKLTDDQKSRIQIARNGSENEAIIALDQLTAVYKKTMGNIEGKYGAIQ
jgi:ABC-type uncharacterized transport system fused permease/ATPase subunit